MTSNSLYFIKSMQTLAIKDLLLLKLWLVDTKLGVYLSLAMAFFPFEALERVEEGRILSLR